MNARGQTAWSITQGDYSVFFTHPISATLLPLGSEPVVFGLVKLNPQMFWPAIAVATLGNTLGGAIDWYQHNEEPGWTWLERLDQAGGTSGGSKFYVYQVRNGKAENLAQLIGDLASGHMWVGAIATGLLELAVAAWLAGDGALAWCAVDRCLCADPDHVLGQLLV